MILLIAILLALIPAIAILYPFIRRQMADLYLEDESSPQAELSRRWEAAVSGLKSAELERAIGNLEEQDYRWLRQQYMTEAARIMRAMELEKEQEQELRSVIEQELRQARMRALGKNGVTPALTCPDCSYGMDQQVDDCPNCGSPMVAAEGPSPGSTLHREVPSE